MPSKRKADEADENDADEAGEVADGGEPEAKSTGRGRKKGKSAAFSSSAGAAGDAEIDGLAVLKKLVGAWDIEMTMYKPDGTALGEAHKGTSSFAMILDESVLAENYSQEMLEGKKFDGISHYCYDKLAKEFQFSWVTNYASCVRFYQGQMDGDTITFKSVPYVDTITKQKQSAIITLKFVSDTHSELTLTGVHGRKHVKEGVIVYRKRA